MFYAITYNQFNTRGFAWAEGYSGPLPGKMSFFENMHPMLQEMKLKSWKIDPCKPGIHIDRIGVKWPDILGNGAGHPHFFCSENVLNTFEKNNVPLAGATEMPITVIHSKRLKDVSPPKYYVIEAPFGIELDYAASGVAVDAQGKPVTHIGQKVKWKLKLSTWSGADLVAQPNRFNEKRPSYMLYCTERIKELAKKDDWKNVKFEPLECVP
jgi:hypothetical protein